MCGIDAFSCDDLTIGRLPGCMMVTFQSGVMGLHSPAIIRRSRGRCLAMPSVGDKTDLLPIHGI